MKKLPIVFILIILISSFSNAIEPISRTDNLIKEQHQETREFCKAELEKYGESVRADYEKEKKELIDSFSRTIWMDRVLTAFGIFLMVVIANSFSKFLYAKNLKKYETLMAKYKGWEEYQKHQEKKNI